MVSVCSIAGSPNKKFVQQMLKKMSSRGPDDSGVVDIKRENFEYYVGMNRLSIIDLVSEGLCPHEYREWVLSYNGEVYNYLEIKKTLEALGETFITSSDTEVVLTAFMRWGVKCFEKFNGMFAIALVNRVTGDVILARDMAGQKPLFYKKTVSGLHFSSEAQALYGGEFIREDKFFNTFQHILEETLYVGIYQVPAAHYLVYKRDSNTVKIQPYWEFKPRYINESTAGEELADLLKAAVERASRSDVPYALYYSGGLDSSLLNKMLPKAPTITFKEPSKKDFENDIEAFVKRLDFPVGSFSTYALYKLASTAHSLRYKVVLSGEGADEVFGGYIRYVPLAVWHEMYNRYPSYRSLFQKLPTPAYTNLSCRDIEGYSHMDRLYGDLMLKYEDPLLAMQMFDFKYILPSLLQMGDRMAATFGIENRCPYLDKDLIEFGLSLPSHLKIKNMTTKYLLRKVAWDDFYVRDKNDEKEGLIIPYNKWYEIGGYDRTNYFERIKEVWINQHRK